MLYFRGIRNVYMVKYNLIYLLFGVKEKSYRRAKTIMLDNKKLKYI